MILHFNTFAVASATSYVHRTCHVSQLRYSKSLQIDVYEAAIKLSNFLFQRINSTRVLVKHFSTWIAFSTNFLSFFPTHSTYLHHTHVSIHLSITYKIYFIKPSLTLYFHTHFLSRNITHFDCQSLSIVPHFSLIHSLIGSRSRIACLHFFCSLLVTCYILSKVPTSNIFI